MAITRSSAWKVFMLPSPARCHSASSPAASSFNPNCTLSQISDSTTSGSPKRLTMRRTSVSIEPRSSSSTMAPHSSVGATRPRSRPKACRPMARVPSRMTTSSKVAQPSSCTTLSRIGRRAKPRP